LLAPGRGVSSYAELREQIASVHAVLAEVGIGGRDRVALVLPDLAELATAFLGVATAAVSAPLNPALTQTEIEQSLRDLGATALVTTPETAHAAAAAARLGIGVLLLRTRVDLPAGKFDLAPSADFSPAVSSGRDRSDRVPEATALVLHTSGTTARPKRVPLTHPQLAHSAECVAQTLALGPDDRCLAMMPFFHIHGLVGVLLASLAAGASVACPPAFDALRFFRWWSDLEPSWYSGVPTMHQAILARARPHRDVLRARPLRLIRSSSAPLPPTVLADLEETFGAPVIESYGMTEAAHQITSNPLPPSVRKPGTVGLATGTAIAILDEEGKPLEPGQTGAVAIRGPAVFSGYEAAPEANADAFVDGWLKTGDEGHLDEDGYLTLTGRTKEIINRGGEKISPREIDEVLLAHPDVAQAVAFAVPHQKLGEDVAVAVVAVQGREVDPKELRSFAAERLAAFKIPRRVFIVDDIPKGPTGKVVRRNLVDAFANMS
jgi:acyl-CoA synthetase (AMP-forming)/AMP-acid ligase II